MTSTNSKNMNESKKNINDININEINKSIVIDLETLNLEYKNLLIKYQQAVLNYVNYLQQSEKTCSNSGDQSCWAIIKGQAYWGVSELSQTSVNSPEECSASCSKTEGCSGATYNPDNNSCILRKGDSSPVISEGSYAIVPKGKKLLQIVEHINSRLTTINEQIVKLIEKGKYEYSLQTEKRENKSDELITNYNKLTEEKIQIGKMLANYKDANEYLEQGDIKVTQNYYSYILLFSLAGLIIFLVLKLSIGNITNNNTQSSFNFQTGGKLSGKSIYIIYLIVFINIIIFLFSR